MSSSSTRSRKLRALRKNVITRSAKGTQICTIICHYLPNICQKHFALCVLKTSPFSLKKFVAELQHIFVCLAMVIFQIRGIEFISFMHDLWKASYFYRHIRSTSFSLIRHAERRAWYIYFYYYPCLHIQVTRKSRVIEFSIPQDTQAILKTKEEEEKKTFCPMAGRSRIVITADSFPWSCVYKNDCSKTLT